MLFSFAKGGLCDAKHKVRLVFKHAVIADFQLLFIH